VDFFIEIILLWGSSYNSAYALQLLLGASLKTMNFILLLCFSQTKFQNSKPTTRYRARKTNQRAAWNKSFAGRNNQRCGICAKRAQAKFEKTQLKQLQ